MAHRKHRYASDDDPQWDHLSENAKGTPTEREKVEERGRLRQRNKAKERFVRLGHDMTGSPGWRALDPYARDAYAWIERRYRRTNNGRIPMSVRELAGEMGVHNDTAHKALVRLQVFGFIAVAEKGRIASAWGERKATRWRLTEYGIDGKLPTRDYLDVDIAEAKSRCNRIFERPTKPDAASHDVGRERPTKPDSLQGTEGELPQSASYQTGQSTASPGEVGVEEHILARVLTATGRPASPKKRKAADDLGNGFQN
jgi:DNA-binding transcriptional regulator YhcF (GntR family)